MMACAFIKYYADISQQKKSETPEFYLDVLDDEELNRVKASLPDGIKVYREDLYDRKRRGALGKLEKLVNIPREIAYNCKAYDMCVVLGGDCISQYYSTQVFVSDMVKFQQISKKQKMYLLGQTMGPFHGYAVGLVKRSLKNTMIYVRDHDCYHYLKETFDFPNLKEARDLAFLDIPFFIFFILLLRSAPTYVHFFGVIKFKLVDTLPAPAAEKLVFDDPFAARTRCVCSLVFIDVNLVNAHRPAVGRG